MITIDALERQFRQERYEKLWLNQPIPLRYRSGKTVIGKVLVIHAQSQSAYVETEKGVGWRLPIDQLTMLPTVMPEPTLWQRIKALLALFFEQWK